jgi:Fe-S-cluster-containing dehydrogenase component
MSDDEPIKLRTRAEITRRELIELFAAGVALLKTGCIERTGEEIRPSVRRAESHPGTPRFYATTMTVDGYGTGLLVETHAGRPTKLEGNPAHPASLGATTAQHQAAILDLYDPHRLRAPEHAGVPSSWERFVRAIATPPPGELWLVLPPDGSRAVAAMVARATARFPQLRVATCEPIARDQIYRGSELAFGARLEPQLALDRADVVVSLDADLLGSMPMSVRWSRDFAGRRSTVDAGGSFARLYVAEPMPTPTGSLADLRLPLRAGDIAAACVVLADGLARAGVASIGLPDGLRTAARRRIPNIGWFERVVQSLARAPRRSVIAAGERQPAAVHALVHRLGFALGNVGATTSFTAVPPAGTPLSELQRAIDAGRVGAVIAIECDPTLRLGRVPLTVHADLRTGSMPAAWKLPLSHFLEAWGDARAYDGTASLIQPAIRPLHDSRSRLQIVAMLAGVAAYDDRALVRDAWRVELASDAAWNAALAEGVIAETAAPAVAPRGDAEIVAGLAAAIVDQGLEIDLAPSPSVGDGRFAGNPWLQELPHPITKQTWGNAALLSTTTAQLLGVEDGDALRISSGDAKLVLPAIVVAGHADEAITIELGYGKRGPIADVGANGYLLGGPIVRGAEVVATGNRITLARTQQEFGRHDRETAFVLELGDYRAHPDQLSHHRGAQPTLLGEREKSDVLQWAMTIDTTICTGCSSCVVACQAENNIPVVGFDEVRRGREMHWIRIDTYVEGDAIVHQPMLCQHCEHAPCEYVCPVFATTHSPDGLNEMTYNRCVGTRFCSNNCPYKVRRFNWFGYDRPATIASLQHNPDVTVRARGVMEKCTYCVQRIRAAEIRSRVEKREIAPGEVVTACQQACPTNAITFGALQHDTAMTRARKSPRAYAALHELGARPRTIYLAKVRDPEGR